MKKTQFLFLILFLFFPAVSYAGNVSLTQNYAWGEVLGWINFSPTNGDVTVTNSAVTGYAWSANYGWINLNPTNGGVVNDGNGNLSGMAWGSNTGWINFAGVAINSSGQFVGHTVASTNAGTINFSCSNCLVVTRWGPAGQMSNPPASSFAGSVSLGGYSHVPYAIVEATSSGPKATVNVANVPLNLVPVTVNGRQVAQPESIGPNNVPTNATNSLSTSTLPFVHVSSHSEQEILKDLPLPTSNFLDNIEGAPLAVKVTAGASVLLLAVLIIWKLLLMF